MSEVDTLRRQHREDHKCLWGLKPKAKCSFSKDGWLHCTCHHGMVPCAWCKVKDEYDK